MKNLLPLFILVFAASINAATFTVTRSDDRNAVCNSGIDCSLREAVSAANLAPTDDAVNFAQGLTSIALSNQIVIENAGTLTINGLGARFFTINGNGPNNQVIGVNGYYGHRIFYTNSAIVTITDVTIKGGNLVGGFGGSGGGIFVNQGSLTLNRVHVTGNSTWGDGGGICYSGGAHHRIINSTISGNSARSGGGGFAGSPYVFNSTISSNSAENFNVKLRSSAFSGDPILRNVTIAFYASRLSGPDVSSDMKNTISMTNGRPHENVGCQIVGDNLIGNCDASQFLGPLQYNGGPTPTHALLPGSPAIDAGNNAFAANPLDNSPFLTDQRGFRRIVDGNGNRTAMVDIGAFELQVVDADNDGIADTVDNCVANANTDQLDTDNDDIGNVCDSDDDNDGVNDAQDAFPLDASESADTDSDGVGNNADSDDDNDNQTDADEIACGSNPLSASSKSLDTDGDNRPNCIDTDDDNDSIADRVDNCPLTSNPDQADFDLDGIGDTCDPQTGAPKNTQQCKNGGWMRFNFPRTFKNQGDCIQFVNTGK